MPKDYSTRNNEKKSKVGWFLLCIIMIGVWLNGIFWIWSKAVTTTWDLGNVDSFEVDQNAVTMDSAGATLKSIDQKDDDNSITGFGAGVSNNLSWSAIDNGLKLTADGVTAKSGIYTSRIIDIGASVNWTSLLVTPLAPFGKELLGNQQIETGYPEGNADMTGNVGLFHFNEAPDSLNFTDSSSLGNNGSCVSGKCPSAGNSGVFGSAVDFDGVDDYIDIGSADNLALGKNFTVEAWVKPGDYGIYRTIVSKEGSFYIAQTHNTGSALLNIAVYFLGTTSKSWIKSTSGAWLGAWSHIAVTYDGATIRFYVNGKPAGVKVNPGSVPIQIGKPIIIGGRVDMPSQFYNYRGGMDEVALYNRTLSATEILDHHKRGALKWKVQTRSCSSADCSDAGFVGPDNTNNTFYSDFQNQSVTIQNLSLSSVARYFQYALTLELGSTEFNVVTQNVDFPVIKSVEINPAHYYGGAPTLKPSSGNGSVYLSVLKGFSTVEGGSPYYQITNEGENVTPIWYYWDGSTWASALSSDQYNTSSTISANINSFSEKVGTGNFSWRAFLASANGLVKTTLSKVYLSYNNPPTAPSSLHIGSVGFESGTAILTDATSTAIHFSAVYNDDDSEDRAVKAQIQISTFENFSNVDVWDSGVDGTEITTLNPSQRTTDIVFGSFGQAPLQQLALNDGAKTYYWRIKFWDVSAGVFSESGSFSLMDAPVVPAGVAAARISDSLFKIDWQDISTNVDFYLIERNSDTGSGFGGWQQIGEVSANQNTYSDNTTVSNARYQYQIKAKNIAGISSAGADNIIHYTTPEAPANVVAKYVSDGSLSVSYVPQANVEPSHKIERCNNNGCDSETYVQIEGSPFTSSPQTDAGVAINGRYRYRVRAGMDETVTSSYSYSGYEYTTPLAPTGLVAKYNADNDIALTWDHISTYESGFKVYVSVDGGNYTTTTIGRVANVYSYQEGGPGHNYKFKIASYVEATNSNSELLSTESNESETIYSAPTAPTMGTPEIISAESIKWNFVDNATTEEGFKLYTSTGTLVSTLGVVDASSFVENNLIPNTEYSRIIKAYSGSTESASSEVTTTLIWAATPTNFRAESSGRTYLNLAWDGNNPDYTEYYFEDVVRATKYEWKTASVFMKQEGLTCDTSYTYKIKARNSDKIETEEISGDFKTLGCKEVESPTPVTPAAGGSSGGGSTTSEDSQTEVTETTSTVAIILPAPTILKPEELAKISSLPFVIEGQAEKGSEIMIVVAGTTYEIEANNDGSYGVKIIDQLVDGEYAISVSQRKVGGKYGEAVTRKIIVETAKIIVDSIPLVEINTSTITETVANLELKSAKSKIAIKKSAKSLPPIIGAGGQVIKRREPKTVVNTDVPVAIAPTVEKVQEILTEIRKKEAFLVVLGKDIPQFQRRQVDKIKTVPGEQLRLVVRPPVPVHSITARIYPTLGTMLSAKPSHLGLKEKFLSWIGIETAIATEIPKTKWTEAYVFETSDSNLYQGEVDLNNVPEGNYDLIISFNNEDGSRTHLSKKIEMLPNGKVLDDTDRPIEKARIIVYQQQDNGHFVVWNADLYRSVNPLFTNKKGEYALSLPPGKYYVQVDMPRHEFHQSKVFVFDKPGFIINNIVLAKTPTTLWYKFWDGVRNMFNKPLVV